MSDARKGLRCHRRAFKFVEEGRGEFGINAKPGYETQSLSDCSQGRCYQRTGEAASHVVAEFALKKLRRRRELDEYRERHFEHFLKLSDKLARMLWDNSPRCASGLPSPLTPRSRSNCGPVLRCARATECG
jgi:hypothetical protein